MSKGTAEKPERADAARNRDAILAAATDLFDRDGVQAVSMTQIAAAAGVGKGTVFRRFGDRTALIKAILQPRAAELREAVQSGPPPLGPGGEPTEALHRYVDALFDFMWANRGLIRALGHGGTHAYYTNPAGQFWITELTRRLEAVDPDEDGAFLAHVILTALRADILDYLLSTQNMTADRIRAGIQNLAKPRSSGEPCRKLRHVASREHDVLRS